MSGHIKILIVIIFIIILSSTYVEINKGEDVSTKVNGSSFSVAGTDFARSILLNDNEALPLAPLLAASVFGCGGVGSSESGSSGTDCDGCLNYFASDRASVCCPSDYPYYCTGNNKCYTTWNDAYFGNTVTCVLPQGRTCS